MQDTSFADVDFMGHPGVIGTGVIRTPAGVWLVDPGPSTSLGGLKRSLAAIGVQFPEVRGVLLTHIHLDHAGSSGTIARELPHARVFVHERGAPHVIDPSRLLESARRLYAGNLERLWGEVAPVAPEKVEILKGGERLDLDGYPIEVAYTPGHASHHVTYFDPHTRFAFAGDVAGCRLVANGYLVPPTPPPDIDLQAWTASIARISEWNPTRIYMTHFGGVDNTRDHLARLETELEKQAEIVRSTLEEQASDEQRITQFIESVSKKLRDEMGDEQARLYQMAVPLDHCWLGLARYWRKKSSASKAGGPGESGKSGGEAGG